jgi:gas vesicle protein
MLKWIDDEERAMTENRNGFAKGLLVGTMVGAAIVLLNAPLTGKDLRREIRRKANGIREDVGRYVRRVTGRRVSEPDQPVDEPITETRGSGSKSRRRRQEKSLHQTDGV